jgi:hypothetical protein
VREPTLLLWNTIGGELVVIGVSALETAEAPPAPMLFTALTWKK